MLPKNHGRKSAGGMRHAPKQKRRLPVAHIMRWREAAFLFDRDT
jgi:hypothetical protein